MTLQAVSVLAVFLLVQGPPRAKELCSEKSTAEAGIYKELLLLCTIHFFNCSNRLQQACFVRFYFDSNESVNVFEIKRIEPAVYEQWLTLY
uniref:Lipocalin n=1 Tax=Rhipicephalus appendiculatus TaxID=34631 RepID=A0A131YCK4_RHIAP